MTLRDDDMSTYMRLVIDTATKFKRQMLKRGVRYGYTHCPQCAGKLIGRLAGPRNHLHMTCETPDCIRMME